MTFDRVALIDENFQLPPEVKQAFLKSPEMIAGYVPSKDYKLERIEKFWQIADGADWNKTLVRALSVCTPLGLGVVLSEIYSVATTATLQSKDAIFGYGCRTGLKALKDKPITVLSAQGQTRIVLQNFLVDGGVTPDVTAKNYSRGIRFRDSTNIFVDSLTVQNCADWALSFERCKRVVVTNHVHGGGGNGASGGRDGIHFMDVTDVTVDGATIFSGDDCVSLTSETLGNKRVRFLNIAGHSVIAAVVTVGNEGSTGFPSEDIYIANISTLKPAEIADGTESKYVVKIRSQNAALIKNLTINGVVGTSDDYGLWLDAAVGSEMQDVTISNVDVTSLKKHGMYIHGVKGLNLKGKGKAKSGLFDGINLFQCSIAAIEAICTGSSNYGIQLNACSMIDLNSCIMRDNGVFDSQQGGGAVLTNSSGIVINGGFYGGDPATNYRSIRQIGTTDTIISATTRRQSANN